MQSHCRVLDEAHSHPLMGLVVKSGCATAKVAHYPNMGRWRRPCRLQKRQFGVNRKHEHPKFKIMFSYTLDEHGSEKEGQELLHNAVERVRDFAYTEPHAAAPRASRWSELRWGRIRPRNRAPGCASRAGRGTHSGQFHCRDKRRSDARYRVRERPPHP